MVKIESRYEKANKALKPCPFCGSKTPIIVQDDDGSAGTSIMYAIMCDPLHGGCCAQSGWEASEEEAIQAWNRRAKR